MKILNTKFGRQAIAAALILSAMASMSLGAFAAAPSAETAADAAVVAGYLPPQDESTMTQGDIALHSSDAQTTAERDPNYGGYAAPVEDPIQGNVMMIAETGDAQTSESTIASNPAYSARYTVKGLLGKQVLYTASVKDQVLTLSVPEDVATFRATVGEMRKLMTAGGGVGVLDGADGLIVQDAGTLDVLAQRFAGDGGDIQIQQDRKSTRLNSSHITRSRMPSSA